MSISYQEAIAYSFNYASAKPDIGNTEREHILGLCAALEAVGKERAVLADSNTQLMQQNEAQIKMNAQLMHERDALAAHVERLHMAWVDAKRCVSAVALPSLYRVEQYQQLAKHSIEKVESVASDAPATSLARLKAEWQAELLEAITDDMRSKSKELATIGVLDALAAKRRRQAEEADQ